MENFCNSLLTTPQEIWGTVLFWTGVILTGYLYQRELYKEEE